MISERYSINGTLSDEGGMGITYNAFDNNLQRKVVIKTVKPGHLEGKASDRYKELLKDEAKYQAKLNHIHIAQVYDYYDHNDLGHIVFEYVKGKNLDDFPDIFNPNKENLIKTLEILEQIAKGISYAHKNKIIHRDIKPNNIMYSDSINIVKIIDFGIAKIKDETPRDYTAQHFSTQRYAAPERILPHIPEDTEEKLDIFSFGVLCFKMITGNFPFNSIEDYSKIPPSVDDFRDDINEDINEQVIGMLQVEPKERLGSLEGFILGLRKQINQGYKKPLKLDNVINSDNKVRDPIHGYVSFSNEEKSIIDHPLFQRLRRIKQLSTTYLVYPGATHDRFSHSLGVMHVATKIFDELVIKNKSSLSWTEDEMIKQRQMLRIASLLHDIGHAPFSHVGDDLFPSTISNHEKMAAHLIRETDLSEKIDLLGEKHNFTHKEIAGFIEGKLSHEYLLINQILSSPLDADKMDYLLRDSMMSGVTYGNFDIDHLIRSLNISFKGDNPVLVVEKSGIHAFEGLILARYFMFIQVYFHKTRRIYDKILEKVMYDTLPSNVIPSDTNEFLKLDDYRLFEIMKNIDSKWNKMFLNRKHLKLVFQKFPIANDEEKMKCRNIKDRLFSMGFKREDLIIDEFQQPAIKLVDEEGLALVKVMDKNNQLYPVNDFSSILANMNHPIYMFRIYTSNTIYQKVNNIIREELK